MKKLVLSCLISLAFLITTSPFFDKAYAETVYISCPSSLKTKINFDEDFGESDFALAKTWPKDASFPMLNCRGTSPFSKYKMIQTSGEINKVPLQERRSGNEPRYTPYRNKFKTEPFGQNGKMFLSGSPFTETGDPQVEIQTTLGVCEVTLLGYASTTQEGQKIYNTSQNEQEQKAVGEFLIKILTEATSEIGSNISSQLKVTSLCELKKEVGTSATKDEENFFKKVLGGFPVFIGDWFSAVSTGIKGGKFIESFKAMGEAVLNDPEIAKWEEEQRQKDRERFESIMKARGFASEEQIDAVINRMPKLKEISDYQTGKWQQESPFRLDILNGQAQIKYPGSNEWKEVKVGDNIPPGSTIFTGMDSTTILSIRDKGMVEVLPFTQIMVNEQGLEQAAKEGKTSTDIYLRKGEIEVNVDPSNLSPATGVPGWGMSVYGPYYSAAVRGTHFWVKQEEGKQFTTIGVYKGHVEVKAHGSDKSTLVSPKGDKPGVVVVTQKLSILKLLITGVIVATIIMSAVLFLKKRGLLNYAKKGKAKKQ